MSIINGRNYQADAACIAGTFMAIDDADRADARLAADLDALAQSRAEAIQKALLTDTGLEPQRVFLTRNGKVAAADGKVRVELSVR